MCPNFQVAVLEKTEFYRFERPLNAIYEDFGVSPTVVFPIWAVLKVLWGHFLRSWRQSDPETCITPPKLKILSLTFLYLFWT